MSQEELTEIIDVSRQAVSKWEQGESYPEVEKLLFLAKHFNVSLDSMMSAEIAGGSSPEGENVTGSIVISAPFEHVVTTCYKVLSSGKIKGGKKSPQYALYGVSQGGYSFWGEPTTFLGWYADHESLSKEINAIQESILKGVSTYTLCHSVKAERKWLRIAMVE